MDVLTDEVLALRLGSSHSLAQKEGCNRLVINSTNMEVIDTMKNEGRSTGAGGVGFDDYYFLACVFPLSSFEHCNREANMVAHELARLAKFSNSRDLFEEFMDEILPLIIVDVTVISN